MLAVYREARAAIERARSGGGPTALELMTLRMEGHAVHDDAAYVPPEHARALGRVRIPVRRFEAWMREHAELGDDELAALERDVEDAIARGRRARRGERLARSGHARGWRLRRLRRASGQQPLSLPRYRPWFYDLVRGRERRCSCTPSSGSRATGLENVPAQGGVVLAPMHRSYVDSLAVGVPLKQRRFRAMAKYELFLVPLVGRAIALGGGFPVRRAVQDMEAYEEALRLLREGDMLLVFPEGTRNRDGKARPQLGAARLALEAGAALVPVSIARQRPHQAAAAALPEDPRALRRADPARRPAGGRSAARLAHGDEALVRGDRSGPREAPR